MVSHVAKRSASTHVNTGAEDKGEQRCIRLAVLHQAIEPPVIGGVRKAMKPGGYKDSSSDIAYVLRHHTQKASDGPSKIEVITRKSDPDPTLDDGWSFPDTEAGIVSAIKEYRATHFWANTILFASHPLQTSQQLDNFVDSIYMVGQPPQLVERYDDKNWVNDILRKDNRLKLPRSWVVDLNRIVKPEHGLQNYLKDLKLPYPVIGKPIRGRGSHGVKLCKDLQMLTTHLDEILSESPQIMIEEFLAGQEGTVTVMPPSKAKAKSKHWALPVVERFNHADGVAPYNGVVAIVQNSRVVPLDIQAYPLTTDGQTDVHAMQDEENAYVNIRKQCELVAEKLGCTAPMRIDVRRRMEGGGSTADNPFVMFDVNMKPNMTGPGRPGRENQASLTAMAAEALGWDYARLLQEMLETAQPLSKVRGITLPKDWD